MFFLLRMAFWLGVVLVLLPSGAPPNPAAKNIDASDALSAASATVHDVKGFCTREPDACTVGSELATSVGYRARAGAKMLYELLSEALTPQTGSLAETPDQSGLAKASQQSSQQEASQNTLMPADLSPAWRGPTMRKAPRHSA
ncbi:MAG: DUF5330 domain-containing protein [Xanthobacteraceae bacterium]